jgi:hypothetical protein
LANNDGLNQTDKLAKIRPLLKLLNQRFQQWGIFEDNLSIDEAMIKYFGHHSAKQPSPFVLGTKHGCFVVALVFASIMMYTVEQKITNKKGKIYH